MLSSTDSHSVSFMPEIVIHRGPTFSSSFFDNLSPKFTLLDPISTLGPDPESAKEYLRAHASSARALVCAGLHTLGKDTLDCLPSLELVAATSIGTDHIDLAECRRRGISLCNVGEVFSDDAADYAVGLLLDVLRKVSSGDRFVRAGSWPALGDFPLGSAQDILSPGASLQARALIDYSVPILILCILLGKKRVGIIGLGSIGSRIAKRLTAFGCSIAYNSRHKKPSVSFPYFNNAYDLALHSDILILSCSLTEQTHHLINKDIMNALGKDGIIINIGRGALIDESEMVQFLVEGRIRGAGLDVFENEPHVPQELFDLDNVVLSPHLAVSTPESIDAVPGVILANLEAFFSDKPLISPIR